MAKDLNSCESSYGRIGLNSGEPSYVRLTQQFHDLGFHNAGIGVGVQLSGFAD